MPESTAVVTLPDPKSARKSGQFQPGNDPRRGRGPAPGAPNAGRPPNRIRELASTGLEHALPGISQIASGAETVTVLDKDGNAVELLPAHRDRINATRLLADVAGETKTNTQITAAQIIIQVAPE